MIELTGVWYYSTAEHQTISFDPAWVRTFAIEHGYYTAQELADYDWTDSELTEELAQVLFDYIEANAPETIRTVSNIVDGNFKQYLVKDKG